MDELKAKTGGAAKAAGETAAGKMKRFQNSLNETQESIGGALLPVLVRLMDILVPVGLWAQKHGTLFAVIAGGVAVLAAAVIALNVAMTIYTAVTTLAAAATEATWLAALGPIALVIIAVAAVVAIIVILWKKSETFRRIVLGVWGAIKAVATVTGRAIMAVFRVAFAALSLYVRAYVLVFRVAFAVVKAVAGVVASVLKTIWRAVWSVLSAGVRAYVATFRAIFNTLSGVASGVARAVTSAWESVWRALKSGAEAAGRVLSGPFEAVHRAIDGVISAIQSLIGWLSRIHVPKISLPHVPGLSSLAAPVSGSGGGVAAFGAPGVPMARAAIGASAGGVTININGAIDPEGTARQVNRILGGHTRRIGARPS
jgi:phage-related protein